MDESIRRPSAIERLNAQVAATAPRCARCNAPPIATITFASRVASHCWFERNACDDHFDETVDDEGTRANLKHVAWLDS